MTQLCEICEAEIEYGWPVSCLHCSTHLTPLEKAAPDLLAACECGHDDDDEWLWRIFNFLAAAPDLLAAHEYTLEAICAGMDSLTMDEVETRLRTVIGRHLNDLDDLAEKFRMKMQKECAAIAKAKGEQ